MRVREHESSNRSLPEPTRFDPDTHRQVQLAYGIETKPESTEGHGWTA